MIYTLGHTKSYLQYYCECLKNNSKFLKLGKQEIDGKLYPGGYAFKNLEEALQFLKDNKMTEYSVFGLKADWSKDTENNESNVYNNLLYDSELIILDNIKINKDIL